MQVFKKVRSLRDFLCSSFRPIVLVPTMGALHEGHAALIRRGKKLAGKEGTVVVSLFVNPTQFGAGEDLAKYPRRQKQDLDLCRACGVDVVFMPNVEQMYQGDHSVFVEETRLSRILCGQSRPGHFRGVCTIVAKLFHICSPDIAVFGQKDWQQLAIIRQMVRDLDFQIRIVSHPTIREVNGLAISSRNAYLSEAERSNAGGIFKSLCQVRRLVQAGEQNGSKLKRLLHGLLQKIPGAKLDYAEIVDPNSLQPVRKVEQRALAIVAIKIGATRLIDNMVLQRSAYAKASTYAKATAGKSPKTSECSGSNSALRTPNSALR